MPAPVTFTLSLAPLPTNFTGTLQDWATAVINRLTIAPSAPWSSFQNGGALGGSDVGPILYQGIEWRVFDTGLGAYTYHKQNGAGLVDNTVPLSKLTAGTTGSLLQYDGSGRPAQLLISSGTDGQVLTRVAGVPAWTTLPNPPGATCFEATCGSDQNVDTDGSTTLVHFDTVKLQSNVVFDTGNYGIIALAGSTWHFYGSLQMEDVGAASTGMQLQCLIGGAADIGVVRFYKTAQVRDGFSWSGTITFASDTLVRVNIIAIEDTPASPGIKVAGNGANTRFGGFKIS